MTLGEYIRLYRAEHGLSQRELVERCGGGITHGYISIIEKGVHQMQLIQTLARVGRVFVMSVSRPR